MPSSIRPGDVLADRYRLVDLLTESGGGRFWRAHDRILERHVALHVIPADDERADALLDAARRSANVHDPRLLRVLDADKANGLCYVVNEWGTGDSLDIMLAGGGPLGPRRAAWLVSEVAASIAVGHEAGVAHGRLIPENVLVDHSGAVRLIGFAVDAAMHGVAPGKVSTDVADLGGLLYCALTGKWPGTSGLRRRRRRRSSRARCSGRGGSAPGSPGRWTRCATRWSTRTPAPGATGCARPTTWPPPRASATTSARSSATRPGWPRPRRPRATATPRRSRCPTSPTRRCASRHLPRRRRAGPGPEPRRLRSRPTCPPRPGCRSSTTRTTTSPGSPPAPSRRRPRRRSRSRPSGRCSPPSPPTARPGHPGTPSKAAPGRRGVLALGERHRQHRRRTDPDLVLEDVPGRNWLRLAAVIAACLLLLVAIVVAYNLGRGRTPLGAVPDDDPDPTPSATSPSASAPAAQPIEGITATDFDPQGDPPFEENPDLARAGRRRRPGHQLADVDVPPEPRAGRPQDRRRADPRPRRRARRRLRGPQLRRRAHGLLALRHRPGADRDPGPRPGGRGGRRRSARPRHPGPPGHRPRSSPSG